MRISLPVCHVLGSTFFSGGVYRGRPPQAVDDSMFLFFFTNDKKVHIFIISLDTFTVSALLFQSVSTNRVAQNSVHKLIQ